MLKTIYKWMKKPIEDLRKVTISVILLYLLSNVGILWLKNVLQKPVPLWLVMLIVLAIFLFYSILLLFHSYKSPTETKKDLIKAGKYLWETTFKDNAVIHVSKVPLCSTHKLRLTKINDEYKCMEKGCKTSLESHLLSKVYQIALTYIEREIRNRS